MKQFMDRDFLLDTPMAKILYHEYACRMPIFDYHNHLSPKDIAEHRRFQNLTELWLEGDHYKWRAMRANGISERYVTGDADPYEKFEAWVHVLPRLAGSPLYHWTHLELQRYFGLYEPLNRDNCRQVWQRTKEMLASDGFDAVSLLEKMNVKVLFTTDDPADSLLWHQRIAGDHSIPFRVCPSFRPDRYLKDPHGAAAEELCRKYDARDLKEALSRALDYFCENGCRVSDHGFGGFPYIPESREKQENVKESGGFSSYMRFLGAAYAKKEIVMQLHLGAVRNNSPRLLDGYGADAGGDSVGEICSPSAIGSYLGDLERAGSLPRTLLYNLNPADNRMLSTMAVNFAPYVQYGAAWWFNDHIRGIEDQISELMETGSLASSVGMLTDSRSFTSFVRHEYYRRILCAKLGRLVEDGLYPDDRDTLGKIVKDICFYNAEAFFGQSISDPSRKSCI